MRGFSGLSVYKRRANSPFLQNPYGKLGAPAPPFSQKSRYAAIFGIPVILKRACSTDQEAVCLSPAAQTKTRHSGCRFSTSWSLTSSERACAVSILPCGKTLDLQGGSSSSPKSRCAAIFGSPVILKRACLTDQEAVCLSPAAQTKTRHSGCYAVFL